MTESNLIAFDPARTCGSGSATLTMSSQDLADITGKTHRNVLSDIRKMLVHLFGEEGMLSFQHTQVNTQNKRTYPIFRLPKRECFILVSGYNLDLRVRIIDRWQALEDSVRGLTIAVLPDPSKPAELARSWALQAAEWARQANDWAISYDKLAATNKVLEPLALAYKDLSTTDDSFSMRDAPKHAKLDIGGITLKKILIHLNHFNWNGEPNQKVLNAKYFFQQTEAGESASGRSYSRIATRVTQRGVDWLNRNKDTIHQTAEQLSSAKKPGKRNKYAPGLEIQQLPYVQAA